jgi:hypothetical protein
MQLIMEFYLQLCLLEKLIHFSLMNLKILVSKPLEDYYGLKEYFQLMMLIKHMIFLKTNGMLFLVQKDLELLILLS